MVLNFSGVLDHTTVMDVELTCAITGGSTGEEGERWMQWVKVHCIGATYLLSYLNLGLKCDMHTVPPQPRI